VRGVRARETQSPVLPSNRDPCGLLRRFASSENNVTASRKGEIRGDMEQDCALRSDLWHD